MNSKPFRVWLNKMIKAYCPKWILARMTLCRDILPWMEKKDQLTLWQKIQLKFHIIICPPCWDYDTQLSMISKAFKKMFSRKNTPTELKRIENLEEKVIKDQCHCGCHDKDPEKK